MTFVNTGGSEAKEFGSVCAHPVPAPGSVLSFLMVAIEDLISVAKINFVSLFFLNSA